MTKLNAVGHSIPSTLGTECLSSELGHVDTIAQHPLRLFTHINEEM